jgi:hypothetical protein
MKNEGLAPKRDGLPDRKTRACPRTRFRSRPITEQHALTTFIARCLVIGQELPFSTNQHNCLRFRSKPIRMRKMRDL